MNRTEPGDRRFMAGTSGQFLGYRYPTRTGGRYTSFLTPPARPTCQTALASWGGDDGGQWRAEGGRWLSRARNLPARQQATIGRPSLATGPTGARGPGRVVQIPVLRLGGVGVALKVSQPRLPPQL